MAQLTQLVQQPQDLRFGLSARILSDLQGVFAEFSDVQTVLVFGSRATANFQAGSDIDLAVIAPTMSDTEFARLWIALDALPLVFRLDVLHLDRCQNANLLRAVSRHGVIFFEQRRPQSGF